MKKLLLAFFLTSLFPSCGILAENNATYIYEGRYGAVVAYRIENHLIHVGRYGTEVFGRIENNLIYKGRYGAEVLYWVER
ncbi:MAG: hypothetical protein FWC19_06200 [Treponema sp.]|nr:hypothetical protein [Treponema sp.]MCL2272377.1 hypothetical protein [Treponema sp.]